MGINVTIAAAGRLLGRLAQPLLERKGCGRPGCARIRQWPVAAASRRAGNIGAGSDGDTFPGPRTRDRAGGPAQ
jgi:Ser/Thr protein kinase RdoA (MazF antagonist)